MRNLFTVVILSFFIMATIPMNIMANAQMGQKLYKKKLRKKCGFSGVRFGRFHTQQEWEELHEKGKYKDEVKRICPKLKLDTIKEQWWEDIYDFSKRHASDGVIPEC